MLKNGQTYFKNLAVFTFLKYVSPYFNIIHERVKKGMGVEVVVYRGVMKINCSRNIFKFSWKIQTLRSIFLKKDSGNGASSTVILNSSEKLFC